MSLRRRTLSRTTSAARCPPGIACGRSGAAGLALFASAAKPCLPRRNVAQDTSDQRRADPARTTYCFDVRSPEEYRAGHLPGFAGAPGGQLVQATDLYAAVRNARIVLADADGVRARMTGSWLTQMGWPEVCVLEGVEAGAMSERGAPPARVLGLDATRAEMLDARALQALLAARLDQLERPERAVLERGAVEGEIFHRGSVQALAGEEQVTPRLAALVRKQLIRPDRTQLPGDDGFRFRHLLIRDAAYDALPKATRAELHAAFARWLEQHGTSLVELDEIGGNGVGERHVIYH